jgi:hypothetical protein
MPGKNRVERGIPRFQPDFQEQEKCGFSCEIVTSDGLREATRLNEIFMYLPQPAPSAMREKLGTPGEQAFEVSVEPIMILRTIVR